jgi:beta-lactamase regulating signal transducer with metallopeptidase domain
VNVALGHLVLASIGLGISALAAAWIVRRWRARPIAAYRLVLALVVGALALPLVQMSAQGRARTAENAVPVEMPWLRLFAAPEESSALDADDELVSLGAPGALARVEPVSARLPRTDAGSRVLDLSGAARILLGIYLVGVLVAIARTCVRWRRTLGLLSRARPAPRLWVERWREVARGSRVGKRTRVLVSDELRGPACFGFTRGTLVLPDADVLRDLPSVARCVLLHELVHLERRDTLSLFLREALSAVFWFHPAAWWFTRTLDGLRELSCDALVVARTGEAKRYAAALVEYASWRNDSSGPYEVAPLAASWPESPSSLHRRIDMLISLRSTSPASRRGAAVLGVVLLGTLALGQAASAAAFLPGPKPAPAQRASAAEPLPAPVARRLPKGPQALTERVIIGLHYDPVSEVLASQLGRSSEGMIVITKVIEGSPAERVGLQRFDVLAGVDGRGATRKQLEAAGRRLAQGESIELEVIRGGQATTFVIGPIDASFRTQWNETVRSMRVPETVNPEEMLDLARRYYSGLNNERFRGDLYEALGDVKNSENRTEATQEYARVIQGLLQQEDTSEYLQRARQALESMTPKEFWKHVGERFRDLDPKTRTSILHRWRDGAEMAERMNNKARSLPGDSAQEGSLQRDPQRDLARARLELQRSEEQLQRLRWRIEELERRQQGR